ncbi:3274_t:CDS:2, partial [Racocetra fulgida]
MLFIIIRIVLFSVDLSAGGYLADVIPAKQKSLPSGGFSCRCSCKTKKLGGSSFGGSSYGCFPAGVLSAKQEKW